MYNGEDLFKKAADLIYVSKKTIVLTGAGISTESGIPDFRSPETGLWENMDPMEALSAKVLFNEPKKFYKNGFKILTSMINVEPNNAHYILAKMESMGIISSIITQNIDNLHKKAGSKKVFEVHGNIRTATCVNCGKKISFDKMDEKVNEGQIPPRCDFCKGIIRPDVVMFGDPMPYEFEIAIEELRTCDLLLIVGSSLLVSPVNYMPDLVDRIIIINKTPTPFDEKAEVIIRDKASVALEKIFFYLNRQ